MRRVHTDSSQTMCALLSCSAAALLGSEGRLAYDLAINHISRQKSAPGNILTR